MSSLKGGGQRKASAHTGPIYFAKTDARKESIDNDVHDACPHPRIGPHEIEYQNEYQKIYKVQVNFGAFTKEIFVTDYGDRAGLVVEGPEGILLTRQYRHLIDRVSWEIPGGKVDPGEGFEEAARRECLEETGVLCREVKPLIVFHPGLDTLHNPSHLFYSRDFETRSEPETIGKDEVCGREWIPIDRCIAMISSQTIVDSLSVIALLSYNTFIKKK